MQNKVSVGIIGFGYMGKWHYQHILNCETLYIRSVFDTSAIALTEAEQEGLVTYTDIDSMLNDNVLEAVLIATPNSSHAEYIEKAFLYGKHVICEKPVTLHYYELLRLVQLSEINNCLLTAHFNRRWDVDFSKVQTAVESGILGKINYIESRVLGQRGIMYGWRAMLNEGGGLFLDWAPHLIDQALVLNRDKKVISISSTIKSVLTQSVDDYFRMKLYFDNEITMYIECGIFSLFKVPRWYVYGNRGTLQSDLNDSKIVDIALIENMDKPLNVCKSSDSSRLMMSIEPSQIVKKTMNSVERSHYKFYDNFAYAVRLGEQLSIGVKDILRVSKLMDTALEASRQNQSITVNI